MRRSRWIQNASVLCDRRHSSRFGFELDRDLGGGGAHYGRGHNGSQLLKGRVRVDKIVSFFFLVSRRKACFQWKRQRRMLRSHDTGNGQQSAQLWDL